MSLSVLSRRPDTLRPSLLALALCAGLHGTAAFAQEAAPAQQDAAKMLDTITVTSTKRATSLQKTPVTISALTSETLSDTGSLDVRDYAKLVPGLSVVNSGPGSARLAMRGINAVGEATTAVYYDETPVSGSVGTGSDPGGRNPEMNLFDVERIEALRGPQGTLYGASSMGGALRVIFNKPVLDATEGAVQAGYAQTQGGDASWMTNLMFNTPLVKDVLGMRAVLYKRETGGYIDSLSHDKKNVNDSGNAGGRLMFRVQPREDLTVDLSYSSQNSNGTNYAYTPDAGVKWGSTLQTFVPYKDQTRISNVTLNWDLGWATLTGVSSYYDRANTYGQDTSGLFDAYEAGYGAAATQLSQAAAYYGSLGPAYAAAAQAYAAQAQYYGGLSSTAADYVPSLLYYPGTTTNWSNEWRLSSNKGERFDWTTGVYSENRNNRLLSMYYQADPATGKVIHPQPDVQYRRFIHDQFKQQAVYGEGTWHATDALDVTLGLRYYHYTHTIKGYVDRAVPPLLGDLRAPSKLESSESGWLKKLNIAYTLTPSAMLYFTVADGMRPGGVNQAVGLPSALEVYKGDSLWNYEVGAKTSWLDNSLQANVAVYQIDWKDMQVQGLYNNNSYFMANAGKARMRGTEWELAWRPLAGLDVGLNFNYIDAVLTEDQITNGLTPDVTTGRDGDRVANIPHFTTTLSTGYRWSLTSNYDGMLRLDANYVGKSYSTLRPDDPSHRAMGDYTLVNARFGVESVDGKWSGYLYANNLFNKLALTNAGYNVYYYPQGIAFTAPPRTVGIDLKYNF